MKLGDKVKVYDAYEIANKNIKYNDVGTIVNFKEAKEVKIVGVEFDKDINGHSCEGKGRQKHCAWITKKRLKVIR